MSLTLTQFPDGGSTIELINGMAEGQQVYIMYHYWGTDDEEKLDMTNASNITKILL